MRLALAAIFLNLLVIPYSSLKTLLSEAETYTKVFKNTKSESDCFNDLEVFKSLVALEIEIQEESEESEESLDNEESDNECHSPNPRKEKSNCTQKANSIFLRSKDSTLGLQNKRYILYSALKLYC